VTATPGGHLYDACPRCKRYWALKGQPCRRCAERDRGKKREVEPVSKTPPLELETGFELSFVVEDAEGEAA
jgi:hypothetical protein